ncbi:CE295 protein, partial [Upupa epops]|nr:CE295 protein [Upupa epops]
LQGIPCDLTSTISTGSFVTGETLDVSPTDTGLSSDSTEDGVLSGTASHPWNSTRPCRSLQRQGNLSGASGTRSPEEEKYHRLQQVLQSAGEFSSHSEENTRFRALPAELDVPEAGRPLPSFHHQVFEPLEPSLDSDNSSTCSQYRRAEGSRESTKIPELTTKGREMSALLEAGSSALCVRRGSLPSGLETTGLSNRMSEKESVNVP